MLHYSVLLLFPFFGLVAHAYALPPRPSESLNPLIGQAFGFPHTLIAPNGQYSCFDTSSFPTVSFSGCRTTFDELIRSPGALVPHRYQGTSVKPAYLRTGPCTVILGTTLRGSVLDISLQQIVIAGQDLLTACRRHSRGGINYITPDRRWYVAVRGDKAAGLSMQGLVNGTVSQQ